LFVRINNQDLLVFALSGTGRVQRGSTEGCVKVCLLLGR
jgi:hypothetical protein